ncbi:TonB-dependent siderophore receptor [Novosphingobium guangzhouense]|uniref:Ligand-gated channel n=1 Tax=Novosphingobium guangzhouense TaxID=1850347 RepID=A0A2K2G3X3_9SPHN|nr:TonB-dependent siderophore receptor [Novosphingobium guangzhouense]PNU05702.1 ligand-gated channel [Novosphingobium guangzhouense]
MLRIAKDRRLLAGTLPFAMALAPCGAAAAEEAEAASEERREAITVTGVRQAYRGNFAVSEIPQSIAEIDAKTLEQNGIQRLTDALDLNASVVRQNTLGGLWDAFAIRGFTGDENMPSGYLVNGFNGGRGFGGQRDTAGIERVEVLKGPAAALIGRGEPGGTINLVTKQAELGHTFGAAAIQYGSWNRVRGEADVNVALTGGLTVRLIGYAEDGDTFRNHVHQSRWGFLPSVGLALGPDTRLTYDLEKTRVAVPFDRGIVVLDGNFDTVPRSRFLGEPGDGDTVARAEGHQLRLDHQFSDRWSLLVGGSIRDTLLTGFSSDAETAASRQALYTDGRSLSRQRRSRRYDARHYVLRAELAGEFETGALAHRVLIGADYDNFDYKQLFLRFRPPTLSTNPTAEQGNVIDILDPVYGRFPLPIGSAMMDRTDRQTSIGAYVQDQIAVTDRLQLRVGGRFDHLTLETDNRLTSQNSRRKRSRFSPQAGVVYEVSEPVTVYATYGQGFRANVGTDVNGQIFDPEHSESFEAGAKLSLMGGALTGTLSLFHLTKANVLATDPNAPGFSLALGKARSRGAEFDLAGKLPGRVDILVTYAYVDAEARSAMVDPNTSFQVQVGDALVNIPRHNLNMQISKAFTLGEREAQVGAGMQYVGKRRGETGTDFMLPSHTLFRLFGKVDVMEHLELFGSITNLFDEHWYANSYSPLWVQPGAPRTGTIGLRAQF